MNLYFLSPPEPLFFLLELDLWLKVGLSSSRDSSMISILSLGLVLWISSWLMSTERSSEQNSSFLEELES